MLRSFGIRAKILAVLALPVLVLSLAAGVIATSTIAQAGRAGQVEGLTIQASGLTDLLRGLQTERGLSLQVMSGDESLRDELRDHRNKVDAEMISVRQGFEALDLSELDEGSRAAAIESMEAHDMVPELRRHVDGGLLSLNTANQRYSEIIATDVRLPAAIADGVEDRRLAELLRSYTAAEELAEALAVERETAMQPIAVGKFTPEEMDASKAAAERTDMVRQNTALASAVVGIRTPTTSWGLERARQRTIHDADGVLEGIDMASWRKTTGDDIATLNGGLDQVIDAAQKRSAALLSDATQRALQVIIAAVAAVAIPVALALLLSRRITRPLRHLTEAAAQIREDLPKMVERMATPGEGPGMTVPDIPVESNDEIGRLAAAFNDVNATTVQVAHDQAALRGSIAAMFVNVARRDQVLLSRQLSFLDQLERTEENPDTLDNLFKLDHLATRMRRNAESLLVLAGIDTGRRLRRPMPLSDVVRTASSEIEHYERVDLAQVVDPPMVGHTALLTAHLIAELLENATSFSDPGSRVVVTTDSHPDGILVSIADEGLGMSSDEIAEANDRIQNPPVSEVVGAQRLGFYVVGRLAKRLDAVVTLSPRKGKGTLATIELPPALFVPGSVATENEPSESTTPGATDRAAGLITSTPPDIAPTGAESLGAASEALNGAALAAAAASLSPVIIPSGSESGLPQRGASATDTGLPKRSAPGTDLGLPQRGAPSTGLPPLPSRIPAAILPTDAPPAVPSPRTEATPPEARSGLFTGFRARRASAVHTVPAPADPLEARTEPIPTQQPEVAQLDDEAVEQPYVAELVPDPEPAQPVRTVDSFRPAQPVQPAEAEHASASGLFSAEDTPLWAATVASSTAYSPPGPTEHESTPERHSAASELSALATHSAPVTRAAPVEQQPVAPTPVFSSASAQNILPGADRGRAGSRGLKLPRRGRDDASGRRTSSSPVPVPLHPQGLVGAANVPPPNPEQLVPVAAALAEGAVPFVPTIAPSAPAQDPTQDPTQAPSQASSRAPSQAPAEAQRPGQAPGSSGGDRLRQRSALASEALSELSRLSSYRPDATVSASGSGAPALARRTRGASAAAEVAAPQQTVPSRPSRSAAEVRSMLSGFQAGVTRGRNTPAHAKQDVVE